MLYGGQRLKHAIPALRVGIRRYQSTLPGQPYIYAFPLDQNEGLQLLTLLSTSPPRPELAIGTSTDLPPTPESFVENRRFLPIVQSVLKEHAHEDPRTQAQARAFASTAGSTLGSGGAFFARGRSNRPLYDGGGGTGGDGAGGASGQGGAGGGGRGGHIHVSDERAPPDMGRIAWPEDIFGSLEVDSEGKFVDGHGHYQESGTYRLITRDGLMQLSPYLRGKLVERLKAAAE